MILGNISEVFSSHLHPSSVVRKPKPGRCPYKLGNALSREKVPDSNQERIHKQVEQLQAKSISITWKHTLKEGVWTCSSGERQWGGVGGLIPGVYAAVVYSTGLLRIGRGFGETG